MPNYVSKAILRDGTEIYYKDSEGRVNTEQVSRNLNALDQQMREYFNSINSRITSTNTNLQNETTDRQTADTALGDRITQNTTAINGVADDLSAETTARTAADATINTAIDTVDDRVDSTNDRIDATNINVAQNATNINALEALLAQQILNSPNAEQSSVLVVSKHQGSRFHSINDAIDYAKTYCNTNDKRVTILVLSGFYNEEIILNPNPGIDFVGVGMPQVVYESTYPHAPLHIFGPTNVTGMTFVNTSASGNAYAMHVEQQENLGTPLGEMKFENCVFTSFANSAVGIGMGSGVLRMFNCSLWCTSNTSPALYLHNYPSDTQTQVAEFYRCDFHSIANPSVLVHNARAMQGNPGTSPMTMVFQTCTIKYGGSVGFSNGTGAYELPTSGEVALTVDAVFNNAAGLNYR